MGLSSNFLILKWNLRIIDFLGDNAKQIDPAEVEQMLKVEMPVLFANEKIELVFKSGRDYNVFTEHRYMIVNVKGITGKRIGLTTILWHTIKMYSVQTAGAFLDRDTEMYLVSTWILFYTELLGKPANSRSCILFIFVLVYQHGRLACNSAGLSQKQDQPL